MSQRLIYSVGGILPQVAQRHAAQLLIGGGLTLDQALKAQKYVLKTKKKTKKRAYIYISTHRAGVYWGKIHSTYVQVTAVKSLSCVGTFAFYSYSHGAQTLCRYFYDLMPKQTGSMH